MEWARVAVRLREARSPKSGAPVAEGSSWEQGMPRAWGRGRDGRHSADLL